MAPRLRGATVCDIHPASIAAMDDIWGVIYIVTWLFFAYSFGGVLVETIYCWAVEHPGVIESRLGILYLPFNPLYGFGGVAVSLLLYDFFGNPLLVFLVGMAVCTTLEFIASLVMEKVFKTVFWDYSDKPLNLHGRICLQFAICWGLLSLFLLYVLDVGNLILIQDLPPLIGVVGGAILLAATIFCTLLTLGAYVRFEQRNVVLRAKRDGQRREGRSRDGKDAVLPSPWWGRVVDVLVPDEVFINTFPRMSVSTEYQELTNQPRKLIVWSPAWRSRNPLRHEAVGREHELRAQASAHPKRKPTTA